ncbi:3-phosphoshikimate 1-carboxyvinyltransferase [Candidatus Kaiserbacteria bacterium]|nr:3-phosphoshikimate 1-carboxyvinyltransferase [Candidatus Kaiserbacteria bacterium]
MRRIRITPSSRPVRAIVSVPGSKSYTNRALMLAALTGDTVRVRNPLVADDTHAMIACLRELGFSCVFKGDVLEMRGNLKNVETREHHLNTFLSGMTARFMLALACIVPGVKIIQGRGRLNERPIGHLVDSLRQLGAKIEYINKKGYPPVRVRSSKLRPGTVRMQGTISSQFLSALLMIAPLVGKVEIEVEGEQISRPYIDMTIEAIRAFGVQIRHEGYSRFIVPARQRYFAKRYDIEGDVSSASYFAAIAALTHSTITLKNVNPKSRQADIRFFKILEEMGNRITRSKSSVTIRGSGVRPVSVDMRDCPDQAQTLAVLAAFAEGVTKITGIQSLRVKETERIAALQQELKKMGIRTESTHDSLTIHGGSPRRARIDTYGDHRMAMAFAVAGTKLAGIEINEPDVVSKTFPRFWETLGSIGVGIELSYERPNIVLIGMRGGGKSTVARHLSERLGLRTADLDAIVEKQEGMSIPEIVERYGWEYFRDRESEVVQKVGRLKDTVISTGGGVINRPENIAALKQRGILVFLNAPVERLLSRLEGDTSRPRLTSSSTALSEMKAVLAERKRLYETVADEIIDDTTLTLEEKVEEVVRRLQKRGIV